MYLSVLLAQVELFLKCVQYLLKFLVKKIFCYSRIFQVFLLKFQIRIEFSVQL